MKIVIYRYIFYQLIRKNIYWLSINKTIQIGVWHFSYETTLSIKKENGKTLYFRNHATHKTFRTLLIENANALVD